MADGETDRETEEEDVVAFVGSCVVFVVVDSPVLVLARIVPVWSLEQIKGVTKNNPPRGMFCTEELLVLLLWVIRQHRTTVNARLRARAQA